MEKSLLSSIKAIEENSSKSDKLLAHCGENYYFYSLSMNSPTPGGSGARPFRFLISATAV